MTLSELDIKWNEILTLLFSDDPEEHLIGEVLKKQFCLEYPEFSNNVKI